MPLTLQALLFHVYQKKPTTGLPPKMRHPQFYHILRQRVTTESSAESVIYFTLI